MLILAMDTSGPVAGVALMRDGLLIHECAQMTGLTHSQTIMPMVDSALESAGLSPTDIDLIAAVTGPGSFTGVRIGVSSARAMAQATGCSAIGVNALEALAAGIPAFDGAVCPMLDARRGQVYAAAFRVSAGEALPQRLLPDDALPLEAFFEKLPRDERLLFLGDGAQAYAVQISELLGERALIAAPQHRYLRAASVAALANARADVAAVVVIASEAKQSTLAHARASEAADYMQLVPYYLRAPQAERERNARLARERGEPAPGMA